MIKLVMNQSSHKIALLSQSTSQEWVSCQTIYRNLVKSYKSAFKESELCQLYLSPNYSNFEAHNVVSELVSKNIETIAFIDYAPHPEKFIKILNEANLSKKPDLIFHIYGDFVLQVGSWLKIENDLKNFNVKFICASHRHAKLLESFIQNTQVEVVPFPVDENEFYFSSRLREETRQKMSLTKDEVICFYSGRLSLQKNILPLIRAFSFFQKHVSPNSKLLLAGPIDDLGVPYLAKKSPPGIMNFDIQNAIQSLFPETEDCPISYLGNISAKDLNATYNASDLFISLSGHNDEDFGMAPAEALMTGCYSVLTDWGGYSSFKRYVPELVSLVPLQIGISVSPTQHDIIKQLTIAPTEQSLRKREELALAMQNSISISNVEKMLLSQLQKKSEKFLGFSELFRQLQRNLTLRPDAPFKSTTGYSQLYKEVYHVYSNT